MQLTVDNFHDLKCIRMSSTFGGNRDKKTYPVTFPFSSDNLLDELEDALKKSDDYRTVEFTVDKHLLSEQTLKSIVNQDPVSAARMFEDTMHQFGINLLGCEFGTGIHSVRKTTPLQLKKPGVFGSCLGAALASEVQVGFTN